MITSTLIPSAPIDTVALFPKLSAELQAVLQSLSAEEWNLPTACAGWTVKHWHIEAHSGKARHANV